MPESTDPLIETTFAHESGDIGLRAGNGHVERITPREALELAAWLDDAAHQALKIAAAK